MPQLPQALVPQRLANLGTGLQITYITYNSYIAEKATFHGMPPSLSTVRSYDMLADLCLDLCWHIGVLQPLGHLLRILGHRQEPAKCRKPRRKRHVAARHPKPHGPTCLGSSLLALGLACTVGFPSISGPRWHRHWARKGPAPRLPVPHLCFVPGLVHQRSHAGRHRVP